MPKRISEIAGSLRQLGEIRVTDWDFMALLNKDIKDLAIGSSLRKLGSKKVLDWDFGTALPAVHKIAHQEVDLVGWVKRAAHCKVMEWDFRTILPSDGNPGSGPETKPDRKIPGPEEMQALIIQLRSFLHFVSVNLIDEPERARILIQEIEPGVLRFKIVVTQQDQKTLLGRDGSTASAIRNLLKGAALANGVHALLQILSQEEELAQSLRDQDHGGEGSGRYCATAPR